MPNKKFDELLPCTYVQVLMEDKGKTFAEPVGRTNTEYYTLYPVYGTNINAGFARKVNSCIFSYFSFYEEHEMKKIIFYTQ